MHKPRSLAQNLIPAFATVCLLGSQARAFIPRRFTASQFGLAGTDLHQSWTSQGSNETALVTVPFAKLPSFLRRTGTPLESTALVLCRMKSLATRSTQNTINSGQRVRLDVLYQANLEIAREITQAAHFQSTFLLDGSNDARLLGPEGSGREVTIDLPNLTPDGIFAAGQSQIKDRSEAMRALPEVCAALALSLQSQIELRNAVQILGTPRGSQDGTEFRSAPDLEVPSRLIPEFVRRTTRGLGQSGSILVAMQALAQHNAADDTTQSERDERADKFMDLKVELEIFANRFSIGDFSLFDGRGEAILLGSGRASLEVEYDLPDLRNSGLFSTTLYIAGQAEAQQTVVSMNYALFQIHEARYELQLAAHLAAL